jgi:hypothetical protein
MKNYLTKSLALSAALVTGGCGSLGDKDDAPEEGKETIENIVNGIDLVGTTWVGECYESDLLERSVRETYVFKGDDIVHVWALFDDAECENQLAEVKYAGEYKLKAEDLGASERKIDMNFAGAAATVNSENGTSVLETLDFCGIESWPMDQEIVLTDAVNSSLCPLPDLPSVDYDFLSADGNKLYFGTPRSTTASEEDRPTEVNSEVVFVKK